MGDAIFYTGDCGLFSVNAGGYGEFTPNAGDHGCC